MFIKRVRNETCPIIARGSSFQHYELACKDCLTRQCQGKTFYNYIYYLSHSQYNYVFGKPKFFQTFLLKLSVSFRHVSGRGRGIPLPKFLGGEKKNPFLLTKNK